MIRKREECVRRFIQCFFDEFWRKRADECFWFVLCFVVFELNNFLCFCNKIFLIDCSSVLWHVDGAKESDEILDIVRIHRNHAVDFRSSRIFVEGNNVPCACAKIRKPVCILKFPFCGKQLKRPRRHERLFLLPLQIIGSAAWNFEFFHHTIVHFHFCIASHKSAGWTKLGVVLEYEEIVLCFVCSQNGREGIRQ